MGRSRYLMIGVVTSAVILFLFSFVSFSQDKAKGKKGGVVGSETCKDCHEDLYKGWPGRRAGPCIRPDLSTEPSEHRGRARARLHRVHGRRLARREELRYPPFARFVAIRLEGRDTRRVEQAALGMAQVLERHARDAGLEPGTVLGPAPAPIERVRGRYRWQLLLRAAQPTLLRAIARAAAAEAHALRARDLRVVIDVDPYSM